MICAMSFLTRKRLDLPLIHFHRFVQSYVQGQSPETNTREYFYFIDHQGQVPRLIEILATLLHTFSQSYKSGN